MFGQKKMEGEVKEIYLLLVIFLRKGKVLSGLQWQ